MQVDLNADLGEGCDTDEALLGLVTSANVACGWHAGDAATMARTVAWAIERGVAIGAHPSFPDREHFGRRDMDLPPAEIHAGVLYQIGALLAITRAHGGRLSHVKAHGALYNRGARDLVVARAVVKAVRDIDPSLLIFGLAGSAWVEAAREAGMAMVQEVFADRAYQADGSLVPRDRPGAVLDDDDAVLAQTLTMIRDGSVRAIDGSRVRIEAETVCLHGDNPHALAFAQRMRAALRDAGVAVAAPVH